MTAQKIWGKYGKSKGVYAQRILYLGLLWAWIAENGVKRLL